MWANAAWEMTETNNFGTVADFALDIDNCHTCLYLDRKGLSGLDLGASKLRKCRCRDRDWRGVNGLSRAL
jgi:hypothetical protein